MYITFKTHLESSAKFCMDLFEYCLISSFKYFSYVTLQHKLLNVSLWTLNEHMNSLVENYSVCIIYSTCKK